MLSYFRYLPYLCLYLYSCTVHRCACVLFSACPFISSPSFLLSFPLTDRLSSSSSQLKHKNSPTTTADDASAASTRTPTTIIMRTACRRAASRTPFSLRRRRHPPRRWRRCRRSGWPSRPSSGTPTIRTAIPERPGRASWARTPARLAWRPWPTSRPATFFTNATGTKGFCSPAPTVLCTSTTVGSAWSATATIPTTRSVSAVPREVSMHSTYRTSSLLQPGTV